MLTLVLTLCMLLSFAACGSKPSEKNTIERLTQAEAPTEPKNEEQTTAPADEGGCGGMIAGAVAIIALLGTAVVFKKKD